MSLMAIKDHMVDVKVASLANICDYFKKSPDVVRCMLSHWVMKGKIRVFSKKAACGGQCFKCDIATTEIYEWCENR